MRLAHFHSRHPVKDLARVEVAKNPALKLEEKGRMQRVAEIQQRVRARQTLEQFRSRDSDAFHFAQLVDIGGQRLMQQAIRILQAMVAKPSLKNADPRLILASVRGRGQ